MKTAYGPGIYQTADNQYIITVGGTTLTTTGPGGSYTSEIVWQWGYDSNAGYDVGTGGGISTNFAIPTYQLGINMTTNQGSTTMRNIPDVALTADNIYVRAGGADNIGVGGTSCAAPLWAGFTALINQQAVAAGRTTVGFINTAVYALAQTTNYASCFHDIVTGNNTNAVNPTLYYACPGYDLCTGWGTPGGQNLITALAGPPDPLGITPQSGFAATGLPGGPFSPSSQVFTLTNSSTSNLVWSVSSTSAWLTVSSGNGTLAATGETNVSVSLNSVANTLALGSYSATVIFSNQASGGFQTRQCILQISDPLLLLTTNGFTAYGPAGGPFSPSSQAVVFTNVSASPVAWSLINTSSWLSVSASSGSIAGNTSASVTVATNASTAGLANGIYPATLVFSNQASHVTKNILFSASVGQNIVQNGGFETGNFTAWTESDTSGFTSVSSSAAHSGTYGVAGGAYLTTGYASQSLATVPGQTYQFSFWLADAASGSTETFQASWNGTVVYSLSNPSSALGWSNKTFIVTATSANTTIQFAMRNDPSYFYLDDVSVTPIKLPVILQQPVSQTNLIGSNVVFAAFATGTAPLAYQWRTNGVKLLNAGNVSGVTTSNLSLTAVTANNAGNYTLVVTNAYGSVTSSVAVLAVVLPAAITGSVTNRTIECGANTNLFAIAAAGTPPLSIQWSFDGAPVVGATNASFALTNVHLPNHTIGVSRHQSLRQRRQQCRA